MKKLIVAVFALAMMAGSAHALTVLNFEGVGQYFWYFGGNHNLANYYGNVNFGPHATILQNPYGYAGTPVPTHSGSGVLFSSFRQGIQMDFGDMVNHVGFYYASFRSLCLFAYDNQWHQIGQAIGAANMGMGGFLQVNTADFDIAHVRMGSANSAPFIIDDLGFEDGLGTPVPEPASILLLASGLLGLAGYGRFRKN